MSKRRKKKPPPIHKDPNSCPKCGETNDINQDLWDMSLCHCNLCGQMRNYESGEIWQKKKS